MPESPSCKHLAMKKISIWASSKAKPLLSQIRFTQELHGNFPERCCVILGMLPSMPHKGLTPGRMDSGNGSCRSQERRAGASEKSAHQINTFQFNFALPLARDSEAESTQVIFVGHCQAPPPTYRDGRAASWWPAL